MNRELQTLVSTAVTLAAITQEGRFRALDEGGGDRHGAWEWCWISEHEDLHHYVSLAALDRRADLIEFEACAGADFGLYVFARVLVGTTQLPLAILRDLRLSEEPFRHLVELLKTAKARAERLTLGEMNHRYPYPTFPRRRGDSSDSKWKE